MPSIEQSREIVKNVRQALVRASDKTAQHRIGLFDEGCRNPNSSSQHNILHRLVARGVLGLTKKTVGEVTENIYTVHHDIDLRTLIKDEVQLVNLIWPFDPPPGLLPKPVEVLPPVVQIAPVPQPPPLTYPTAAPVLSPLALPPTEVIQTADIKRMEDILKVVKKTLVFVNAVGESVIRNQELLLQNQKDINAILDVLTKPSGDKKRG